MVVMAPTYPKIVLRQHFYDVHFFHETRNASVRAAIRYDKVNIEIFDSEREIERERTQK